MDNSNNITIVSRMNVIEFLKSKNATRLDYIKSPVSGKLFFSLNNSEKSVTPEGKEVIGTRGAISKSLQEDILAHKSLDINKVVIADTVRDGESRHCWLLMRDGDNANTLGSLFSL